MSTKIVLKNVRLSYANLFEAKVAVSGGTAKFSTALLIPKGHPQLAALRDAINAEAVAKFGPDAIKEMAKTKSKYHHPLRDGDEEREGEAAYAGMYFANASSKRQPQVVDQKVQPIIDESEIFSGCWANVSINVYPFDVEGSKGIALGLNNVQLVKKDDRLGGATNAEEDFQVLDEAAADFKLD